MKFEKMITHATLARRMNTTEKVLICLILLILGSGVLVERYFKRKERTARHVWHAACNRKKHFLATSPYNEIESPQGQWYLRIEVGAYMQYLDSKQRIYPADEEYYRDLQNLMVECPIEEPAED